jgi:SET domain-containing protein
MSFTVKNSNIHGLGIFSNMFIPENTLLFKAIDNFVITNPAKFINHSENPNTKLYKINNDYYILSITNIKKNQEITLCYTHNPYFIKNHI